MSSTEYSAEIYPDPALRRVVLTSGILSALAGVTLIIVLPVALVFRLVAAILWSMLALQELSRLRRAWNTCHGLRFFADGAIAVLMPGQVWQPACLLPGGILLRKTGWIRLKVALPAGRKIVLGELLRGSCRENHDWRRLQVIWRHVGA